MDIKDLDFLHGIASSLEIMQKHPVGTTVAFLKRQASHDKGVNNADRKAAANILGM